MCTENLQQQKENRTQKKERIKRSTKVESKMLHQNFNHVWKLNFPTINKACNERDNHRAAI